MVSKLKRRNKCFETLVHSQNLLYLLGSCFIQSLEAKITILCCSMFYSVYGSTFCTCGVSSVFYCISHRPLSDESAIISEVHQKKDIKQPGNYRENSGGQVNLEPFERSLIP